MRISTRSRYGLRLMLSLASNFQKGYMLLKDVARREGISEKYLSLIVIPLRKAGLLVSSRGANGGYRLSKPPSEINLKEIIEPLEGDLYVIECIRGKEICEKANVCTSHDIWELLGKKIADFLDTITLEDLLKMQKEKTAGLLEYII